MTVKEARLQLLGIQNRIYMTYSDQWFELFNKILKYGHLKHLCNGRIYINEKKELSEELEKELKNFLDK